MPKRKLMVLTDYDLTTEPILMIDSIGYINLIKCLYVTVLYNFTCCHSRTTFLRSDLENDIFHLVPTRRKPLPKMSYS